MNKKYLLFIITLFYQTANSQNSNAEAIIVDKSSKKPLSFVSIYNSSNSSISNSEGLFSFTSAINEINFSIIGYSPLKTNFDLIKKNDTIFMEPRAILLEEVVINNLEPFMKKVYENLSKNFSQTGYTNDFFLRSVVKKDGEIIKFQDLSGKMATPSISQVNDKKKESKRGIEILNMRKIYVHEKKDLIYFKMPSFKELISTPLFLEISLFSLIEEHSQDDNYRKINFTSKERYSDGQKISGYAIINKKDYAITEYFVSYYDAPNNAPYREMSREGFKTKTLKYDKTLNFSKSNNTGTYYLNNLKSDSHAVVIFTNNEIEKTTNYDVSMNYFVTKNFTNETVQSNFPIDKDIFKAKFSYSDDFWKKQNQLPLTTELKKFIDKASQSKEIKKEFEVIGNF